MLGIRKRRIGILGGSFSPPTNAHKWVAGNLLKRKLIDEVLIMPCGNHIFKKDLIDWKHRVAMCELAFFGKPNVRVSAFDCVIDTDGSTRALLKRLKEVDSESDYRFIIGQDNAEEAHKWKDWEKLREEVKFIIVPRGEESEKPSKYDWYTIKPHKYVKNFMKSEISSTRIRNCFKQKHAKRNLDSLISTTYLNGSIDRKVWNYIEEHKLYKE